MLVPGLKNESLYKITSDINVGYSRIHESLRECAQEMLDKYKQQANQVHTEKLGIKTRAVEILLHELGKVPKNLGEVHAAIFSALKRHAEALHNYEHLLSKKGNTYALLEQTRSLKERHGHAPASLLRYHDLKDILLGPHSPLSAEERRAVCTLAEKKALTLQKLATLDEQPCTEEAGMLSYVIYGEMNFSLQGILNSELLNSVACCTCKKVMEQPVEICLSNHLTCLECSRALKEQKVTSCPGCRACPAPRGFLLENFKQNIPMKRLINNFQTGSFHSALLNSIECCICKNILNKPVEICPGSHLTCRKCSKELIAHNFNRCPMCRSPFTDFKDNKPIERLIDNLQVRCCYADCRSVIKISEIEHHLKNSCGGERMEQQWHLEHEMECEREHIERDVYVNTELRSPYPISDTLALIRVFTSMTSGRGWRCSGG